MGFKAKRNRNLNRQIDPKTVIETQARLSLLLHHLLSLLQHTSSCLVCAMQYKDHWDYERKLTVSELNQCVPFNNSNVLFVLVYAVEVVVELPSLWSPNTRCLKSVTIRGKPLRRDTLGCHPSRSLAFVMSGFLLCGSSSVLGLNSILALGSIVSFTTYMNSMNNQCM